MSIKFINLHLKSKCLHYTAADIRSGLPHRAFEKQMCVFPYGLTSRQEHPLKSHGEVKTRLYVSFVSAHDGRGKLASAGAHGLCGLSVSIAGYRSRDGH
jgi:hypothetical protein